MNIFALEFQLILKYFFTFIVEILLIYIYSISWMRKNGSDIG